MRISVTRKHILYGDRGSGYNCAIAMAFRDAGFQGAIIGWNTVMIPEYAAVIELPESAQKFIEKFADGYSVSPFTFEVDIDDD